MRKFQVGDKVRANTRFPKRTGALLMAYYPDGEVLSYKDGWYLVRFTSERGTYTIDARPHELDHFEAARP